MKKKKLNVKSLSLNKKTISNLNTELIKGGKTGPITGVECTEAICYITITVCPSFNYCGHLGGAK